MNSKTSQPTKQATSAAPRVKAAPRPATAPRIAKEPAIPAAAKLLLDSILAVAAVVAMPVEPLRAILAAAARMITTRSSDGATEAGIVAVATLFKPVNDFGVSMDVLKDAANKLDRSDYDPEDRLVLVLWAAATVLGIDFKAALEEHRKETSEAREAAQRAEKDRLKAAEAVQLEITEGAVPRTLGDALHDALTAANEREVGSLAAEHAKTQAAELAVLRAALRADFIERFSGQHGAVDTVDLIRVVGAMEGRARAAARFDGAMRKANEKTTAGGAL